MQNTLKNSKIAVNFIYIYIYIYIYMCVCVCMCVCYIPCWQCQITCFTGHERVRLCVGVKSQNNTFCRWLGECWNIFLYCLYIAFFFFSNISGKTVTIDNFTKFGLKNYRYYVCCKDSDTYFLNNSSYTAF